MGHHRVAEPHPCDGPSVVRVAEVDVIILFPALDGRHGQGYLFFLLEVFGGQSQPLVVDQPDAEEGGGVSFASHLETLLVVVEGEGEFASVSLLHVLVGDALRRVVRLHCVVAVASGQQAVLLFVFLPGEVGLYVEVRTVSFGHPVKELVVFAVRFLIKAVHLVLLLVELFVELDEHGRVLRQAVVCLLYHDLVLCDEVQDLLFGQRPLGAVVQPVGQSRPAVLARFDAPVSLQHGQPLSRCRLLLFDFAEGDEGVGDEYGLL